MGAVLSGIVGLVLVLWGADLIVRTGSTLATQLGVSPIIVGLTVVSVGTSLPELAVGIDAARTGNSGLATGNIVGTNLVNLLLILGSSALIRAIPFSALVIRRDLPTTAASAVLLYLLARDGNLTLVDGLILCAGAIFYTGTIVRTSRDTLLEQPDDAQRTQRRTPSVIGLLCGIVGVVLGAELLVNGAVGLARELGVSDAVIGLTIVAIGTSAPELVTTLVSTARGERDIAIGNLLGSSVYNILLVLGVTALAATPNPVAVPDDVLRADLMLLLAATAALVLIIVSRKRITRIEGGLLAAAYLTYLVWLIVTRT